MTGDPFRPDITVEVTGPTSSRDLRRARWRDGWRSWWRHRGEELGALLGWISNHPAVGIPLGALLIFGTVGGAVAAGIASSERACDVDCMACGADTGTVRNGLCYCIGDGRAELFGEWDDASTHDERGALAERAIDRLIHSSP